MQIVLHIGAHRTGTTSLQAFMQQNRRALRDLGIAYWGPKRIRGQRYRGLSPGPAIGKAACLDRHLLLRLDDDLEREAVRGAQVLVISDENMIGSMRHNLRHRSLYPEAGARIARYIEAFGGQVSALTMSIRSQDQWWRSALAYLGRNGGLHADEILRARIAADPRGWCQVVRDVAQVAGTAKMRVLPFDAFAGQPHLWLSAILGRALPDLAPGGWMNRSPECAIPGRPLFLPDEDAAMRQAYVDDTNWLMSEAASRVEFITEPPYTQDAGAASAPSNSEGDPGDRQVGALARAG